MIVHRPKPSTEDAKSVKGLRPDPETIVQSADPSRDRRQSHCAGDDWPAEGCYGEVLRRRHYKRGLLEKQKAGKKHASIREGGIPQSAFIDALKMEEAQNRIIELILRQSQDEAKPLPHAELVEA